MEGLRATAEILHPKKAKAQVDAIFFFLNKNNSNNNLA